MGSGKRRCAHERERSCASYGITISLDAALGRLWLANASRGTGSAKHPRALRPANPAAEH